MSTERQASPTDELVDKDAEFYREPWMSDEQWRCAKVAALLKCGFHHVQEMQRCGNGISFYEPNEIATFDFDLMTRAVLLAHEHAVRIGAAAREIESEYEGSTYTETRLILTIHPRRHGEGKMHGRHPDLSALATLPDTQRVEAFAEAIMHGDVEHRAWLKEAAQSWIANRTVPPPRTLSPAPASPSNELREAAKALLEHFPLEDGENERQCRFSDAVADLRALTTEADNVD